MKVETYNRKPFQVDAVQVTEENMADVAEWCQGDVRTEQRLGGDYGIVETRQYVKVRVMKPMNARQTMAFVGDWVLYAGTGYKVYPNNAFVKSFEPLVAEDPDAYNPVATKSIEIPDGLKIGG